jgi:hypothetical protein
MKLFDVMVYDERKFKDVVYTAAVDKREAKRISKALKKKDFKSHVLPTRENREMATFTVDTSAPMEEDEEN